MADFVMPKLGADMTAGTLVEWRKNPGDVVQKGDIIAEVETDKGSIEVEVFTSGLIEKFLVKPGEKVPVGTVLATIRDAGAPIRAEPGKEEPARPAAIPGARKEPAPTPPPSDTGRLRISPSARELARRLGVDPAAVKGTGRDGAITREDVERASKSAEAPPKPVPAPPSDPFARLRQSIAAAMSRSKREIPHYYLGTTIDMHHALAWMAEENQKRPVTERLLHGVLLLKAVALALREVPELNSVWDGDRVVPSEAIHVGVAVSLRKGGKRIEREKKRKIGN